MTSLELVGEFSREMGAVASSVIRIRQADITKEDKAVVFKSLICSILDELSSEDVKDLFNTYPEMSRREDLQ